MIKRIVLDYQAVRSNYEVNETVQMVLALFIMPNNLLNIIECINLTVRQLPKELSAGSQGRRGIALSDPDSVLRCPFEQPRSTSYDGG